MVRPLTLAAVLAASLLLPAAPALAAPSPQPQGYLELCKETRGGLTGTFGFTYAGRTASVTLTPGATQPVCTPALQVTAGQVVVTESAAADTEVCGIRTVQPGRLVWKRGATAAVTVPAGGPEAETTLVFCNRPAPKGSLQICKETQDGLTGTFTFDFAGKSASVAVTGGSAQPVCTQPVTVPAGQVTVTERGRAGTGICGVRTIPTGRLVWARDRSAAVSVPAGDRTVLVVCNRPVAQGGLQVCKVAGTGVEPGTPFTFTIRDPATGAIRRVVVRAGECVPAGAFDDGAVVEVTESPPAGIEVAGRDVSPSTRRRGCPGDRPDRLCAEIAAGQVTEVTFTNRRIDEDGSLRLCKVAGEGIARGAEFTFAVRNVSAATASAVVVPAGQCVAAGEFADRTELEITETVPGGVAVASRFVLPAANARLCDAPRADRVCALVTGGQVTEVTFVNRSSAPTGQLKLCKQAGAGIDPGTSFSFSVHDPSAGETSTAVVTAGQCVLVGSFAEGTVVEVTEATPQGTEVALREVVPAGATATCATPQSNRVCARIDAGLVTHVTFTNRTVDAPVPLKLCKVAGSPGIAGVYRFTVRTLPAVGSPRTVYVGVGACATLRDFVVSSTVEVTEAVPSGETVEFDVVPGGEERTCPQPQPDRVCANVSSTVTKIVATNRTTAPATGTLRVCKVAGVGVAAGTPYDFTIRLLVSGATTAATIAAGSCSSFPGIPAGTIVEATETLPEGSTLPPIIAVDPAAETRICPAPAPSRACANVSAGSTTELRFTNRRAG